ncbi:MAG: hypothetical protein ACRDD7_09975 [Peptostreptococcaceae bacterium]
MEDSKKLFEIIYKFVSKSSDEDLKKLLDGEHRLSIEKKNKQNSKKLIKNKKLKSTNNIDNKDIEALYEDIKKCKSREVAKSLLVESKFTNSKLIEFGKYIEVNIPKSYNKEKIIERIVEIVIGGTLDKESIDKIKLK